MESVKSLKLKLKFLHNEKALVTLKKSLQGWPVDEVDDEIRSPTCKY